MVAVALSLMAVPNWYGPVVVSFDSTTPNPFDARLEHTVLFESGDTKESRPAFFSEGQYWVRFVTRKPGEYSATLQVSGAQLGQPKKLKVSTRSRGDYVRKGGGWGFRLESGEPYWPMGHNLAWQGGDMPDLTEALRQMPGYGANWARIWADHWDGKNPWWHRDPELFDEKAALRWDDIVKAAEESGVKFQFVLFHHGPFSSKTDSNWKENPLNVANGGWLEKPDDFFTDERAKRLAKSWIRYAVARWGQSPSIMAWELFNEVDWCDATLNKPQTVLDWHKEMADYVRSLDSYHHLVTTSCRVSLPAHGNLDYWQPHGYPASVAQMVAGFVPPDGRPAFFGEVGPGEFNGGEAVQRRAVRDGLYTAVFHHHAGAAQFWTWDKVYPLKLQSEWKTASVELSALKPFTRTRWHNLQPTILSKSTAAFQMVPGSGWEPFKKYNYRLPEDANSFGGFAAYFQGKGHAEMRKEPVVFRFNARESGDLVIQVEEVSSSGGVLTLEVNGKSIEKEFKAGKPASLHMQVPAGQAVVTIDNPGPDWVKLSSISFPGVGLPALADGGGDGHVALLRLVATGTSIGKVGLGGLDLPNGLYAMTTTDLDTRETSGRGVKLTNGTLIGELSLSSRDVLLRFEPKN